jgi:N-acetylmuramoyl-L-alanine amidase
VLVFAAIVTGLYFALNTNTPAPKDMLTAAPEDTNANIVAPTSTDFASPVPASSDGQPIVDRGVAHISNYITANEPPPYIIQPYPAASERLDPTPVPANPRREMHMPVSESSPTPDSPEETGSADSDDTSESADLPLAGVKIGIDPGHQSKANNETEPIAPGSSEKKAKASSGTAGVSTRVAEYVVNLDVSLLLQEALAAQGAEVFMTRTDHDVNISNIERARMMNDNNADLVLRIHCNGANDSRKQGIGLYVRNTDTGAEKCLLAAQTLLPAMIAATGAHADGIFKNDTYTGLNWSEVPSILVEMGFMSNPEEDRLLNDPDYQQKLVDGMVNGIIDYIRQTQQ